MNVEALRFGMKVVHTVDGTRGEVRGILLAESAPPMLEIRVEDDVVRCDCGCEHCCPWSSPMRAVPLDEVEAV